MLPVYLFSVIVGGVLLAVGALGSDHDQEVGSGLDSTHHDAGGASKIFSLRVLTYLLFVFGGVGVALTWSWRGRAAILTFLLASVAGIVVAGLVGFAFRYLARTESGAQPGEDTFVGLPAHVVLPIGPGGLGKVRVQRGDRSYELLARSVGADVASREWKSVVVVEMRRGTAIVAPVDEAVMPENS